MPKSQHTQEKELGRGKSARGPQPFSKGEWGEMENVLKHIRGHLGKAANSCCYSHLKHDP